MTRHAPTPLVTTTWLAIVLAIVWTAACASSARADDSALWGRAGERWDPRGRLPDFSYAGYRAGRVPIPDVPVVVDVRDFGATRDGSHDDTEAIRSAMTAAGEMGGGAVWLPAGRYRVRDVLRFAHDGVVLRGAGPAETILAIDTHLRSVRGAMYGDSGTIQWSWKGGFIAAESRSQEGRIPVIENAARGDSTLTLETTDGLAAGDFVVLKLTDDGAHSLASALYAEQASASRCEGSFWWPVRIARVDGDRIDLDQPLRLDVRRAWSPLVLRMSPIREIGVEHLAIEFESGAYGGHHRELGYNAIDFGEDPLVVDAWIRDVRIEGADNGIFLNKSKNVTVESVRIHGNRLGPAEVIWTDPPFGYVPADRHSGHHGITAGIDSLIQDVDIDADFIHELTAADETVGSVFANIRSADSDGLSFDHHGHAAPLENLFTDIPGKYDYLSGGLACGVQSGARGTFWGFGRPLRPPPWDEVQTNVVGRLADGVEERDSPVRRWIESVDLLAPANLYRAQLRRRLAVEATSAEFAPTTFGRRARFVEDDPRHWAVIDVDDDARYWLATELRPGRAPGLVGAMSLADTDALTDVTLSGRARTFHDRPGADFVLVLGHGDGGYYYAAFTADDAVVGIHRVTGDTHTRLVAATGALTVGDAFHAVQFARTGDLFTMTLDGIAVAEVRDDALGAGRVGLGSLSDSAYFDDIQIESPALSEDPLGTDGGAGPDGATTATPRGPEDLPVAGGCSVTAHDRARATGVMLHGYMAFALCVLFALRGAQRRRRKR
jgi:hypothetical protein